MNLPDTAHDVLRAGQWSGPAETVTLDYDARFLRRKRILTDVGNPVLVDLPEMTSLSPGDALRLVSGRLVAVQAADEPVVVIRGGNLARLAWHIGNRHTPCQVGPDHLVIRRDKVLEDMLRQLGAELTLALQPFRPEGGAYGHGRTLGHDHGGHSLNGQAGGLVFPFAVP